jgi:hypothetical protein
MAAAEGPAGKASVVTVEPKTLYFPPPHDRPVQNVITVTNAGAESLAIRFKASAPLRYVVKPKRFILNPQQSMQVSFLMQHPAAPFAENGKRDVFLVDCRAVPPGRVTSIDDVFEHLGNPVEQITLFTDATARPPHNAKVTFPDLSSVTAPPQTPPLPHISPSPATSAGPAAAEARVKEPKHTARSDMAAAAAAVQDAKRRIDQAKGRRGALNDEATALESQREELVADERSTSMPSLRLSAVIFCMLSSYAAGMLFSRGWPEIPANTQV